jgi:hypothetical protein
MVDEDARHHGGGDHVVAAKGDEMNEFVFLFRVAEEAQREAMGTPARAQKSMEAWMEWVRELEAKGLLKNPGQPLDRTGKVVRGADAVTDGPFVESKDIVAGFMVVRARDLEHAVELAGGCPMLPVGSVEVRPVMEY